MECVLPLAPTRIENIRGRKLPCRASSCLHEPPRPGAPPLLVLQPSTIAATAVRDPVRSLYSSPRCRREQAQRTSLNGISPRVTYSRRLTTSVSGWFSWEREPAEALRILLFVSTLHVRERGIRNHYRSTRPAVCERPCNINRWSPRLEVIRGVGLWDGHQRPYTKPYAAVARIFLSIARRIRPFLCSSRFHRTSCLRHIPISARASFCNPCSLVTPRAIWGAPRIPSWPDARVSPCPCRYAVPISFLAADLQSTALICSGLD